MDKKILSVLVMHKIGLNKIGLCEHKHQWSLCGIDEALSECVIKLVEIMDIIREWYSIYTLSDGKDFFNYK